MKEIQIIKAESRGSADYAWLKANYYFSFSNYYNPERMHFGMLRVLNDDFIEGGMGFAKHPHDNMEIITIPLEGAIAHEDSMGNTSVIHAGDIQVMSAGTGVVHGEKNFNPNLPLKLFQIWIFPNKKDVVPRYQQITLNTEDRNDKWSQILSPNATDEGVWIHQDAWMFRGDFKAGQTVFYNLKNKENGVYLVLINGSIMIDNEKLDKRDAASIRNTDGFEIKILDNSEILVIEVPMN